MPDSRFIPKFVLETFSIGFYKVTLLCLPRLSLRLSVNLSRVPEMVSVFSVNYRKILLFDDKFVFLKSDQRQHNLSGARAFLYSD